ncbi:hypothetical protein [Thiolapillus sp.]|uniref:hypothetical protein n=1 Tax=Thiolapillus sp. TaxID=2017437 RepID=UPI003AF4F340
MPNNLRYNDIIPVGIGKGVVTLIANSNGIRFLPPSAQVDTAPGAGGYFNVEMPVAETVDAVAARLLGVSVENISAANGRARRAMK